MTFNTFGFHPHVAAGIAAAGFVTRRPIQVQGGPARHAGTRCHGPGRGSYLTLKIKSGKLGLKWPYNGLFGAKIAHSIQH